MHDRVSLKAMPHPLGGAPCRRYYLGVKDYERLAIPQSERPYPHVLVVMRVAAIAMDWMIARGPLTILRASAWWLDLTDAPPATHLTGEPVYLPHAQVFDLAALDSLMREPR